jgi:hypothetical protein
MSRQQERRILTYLVVAVAVIVAAAALFTGGQPASTATSTPAPADATAAPDTSTVPEDPSESSSLNADLDADLDTDPDVGGEADLDAVGGQAEACLMTVFSLRQGQSGDSVECLQRALIDGGYLDGTTSGTFDTATYQAVREVQEERNLFVDGVVGRETAISLEIWPDEESFVVRTPAPPAGAVDSMGYRLSSVASTGDNAPAVPANSGSGRRVVYERAGQRVWAIDANDRIVRSWLVSGSKYANEMPGVHTVYSRSDVSTAWNGKAWLPKMIRYQQTRIGHIGFHAIPLHVEDNSPYQTEAELGTRLSGGCQRQANADAAFLWDFAQVGTTVVVV